MNGRRTADDTFYCFCDRYRALVHIGRSLQQTALPPPPPLLFAAGTGLVLGAGGRGERAMSGKTGADKLEGLWEFYGHMDRRWEADPSSCCLRRQRQF